MKAYIVETRISVIAAVDAENEEEARKEISHRTVKLVKKLNEEIEMTIFESAGFNLGYEVTEIPGK